MASCKNILFRPKDVDLALCTWVISLNKYVDERVPLYRHHTRLGYARLASLSIECLTTQ
jgi:hypothetical protein